MKRFVMTFFAALVAFFAVSNSAYAQKWQSLYSPADELKGEAEYYVYYVEAPNGDSICLYSNENYIKIISGRGIFDYNSNYVSVLVGFYEGDTLVNKVKTVFFVPDRNASVAYTSKYKNPTLAKDVVDWLKSNGEVRIIASKYSNADFDVTAPKFDIETKFTF